MKKLIKIILLLLFPLITFSQTTVGKFDKLYVKSPVSGLGTEKILVWDNIKGEVKIVDLSLSTLTIPGGAITQVPMVGFNPGTNLSIVDWVNKTFYPFVPATLSLTSDISLIEVGYVTFCRFYPTITAHSETIFTSGHTDKISPTTAELTTWTGEPVLTRITFAPIQDNSATYPLSFKSYQTVGNNGTPTILESNAVTITACYPYLYGMSEDDLSSGVGLYANTNKIVQLESTDTDAIFNSSDLKYAYFAFPASYGDITQIIDNNGFDQITAFSQTTANISSIGLTNNWSNVSYKIYKSNAKFFTTPGSWTFTFKQ